LFVKTMLGVLCLSVFLLPAMLFAEEQSSTSYTDNWQSADNERLLNQNETDHASMDDDSMRKPPVADNASGDNAVEDPAATGGDELATPDEGQLMDSAARPVIIPTYGASSR